MTYHLETPKQLAQRVGLPISLIRSLIHSKRLEHVVIGKRPYIPFDSFDKYIEKNRVISNVNDNESLVLPHVMKIKPRTPKPSLNTADRSAERAISIINNRS